MLSTSPENRTDLITLVVKKWTLLLALAVVTLAFGCGPSSPQGETDASTITDSLPTDTGVSHCTGRAGEMVCNAGFAYTCGPDEEILYEEDCSPNYCIDGVGCALCYDGQKQCSGNNVMVCADDYMSYEVGEFCDPDLGEMCDPDTASCVSLCDIAAESKANVGCEYVAVDMVNWPEPYGDEHCFVVLVSNVQSEGNATITVEDEDGVVLDFPGYGTERSVAPGEMAILTITGTAGKCSDTPARPNAQSINSGLFPGTSFYVKSSIPVVAYQVNPYEAALSYSTDASLLIPITALGNQYYVFSYPGSGINSPSTVSIVATEDDTEVTFNPTVAMLSGGPVPASGSFTTTLNAFEHLQILASGTGDLNSSLVSASNPVAVFSGVLCAVIPAGSSCCDHIEQQMPPVQSWGWTYLAATPAQRATEKAYWRIMAALDNTTLSFEPASMSSYNTTLNAGEFLEIDTDQSFLVSSAADPNEPDPENDPPILVNQYIKSAFQAANESGTSFGALGNLAGDPAMALSVPVEQYLNEYIFLADPTYGYNFVVVVRTDPTEPIHLGCLDPIPEDKFETITGDYSRAVVTLSSETGSPDGTCSSGAHRIWSESPFGIWVYGYYECTSYAYPGGMNLEQINEVEVPIVD